MDISAKAQYIQRVTNTTASLTTTNATLLYTAPSGGDFDFVIIESILVTEDGGQQTNFTLTLTDSQSVVHTLWSEHNVPAHSTDELLTRSLVLTAGEILHCTAGHADKLSVIMSLVEYGKGD
jgi:hypothetical protein|tara:strand:+ start:496 stop:861 length:366 start_codon:yes stop_codon:yes gene_type:complete